MDQGSHPKSPTSFRRSTRIAHAGLDAPSPDAGERGARPHAPPIYQTSGFAYPSALEAEEAAEGKRYIYSRYASPNEDALARAVAELEGAEAAVVFASGMGAIAAALESRVGAGDHVVSVHGLYGGTHELLFGLLPRFGVSTTFVDGATADAVAPALRPETKVVYVEAISNPLLRVADLDGLSALCRDRGVALLVDATFATPLLCRPIERGAILSIHSGTKYLGGHGDAICGVVSGSRADVARLVPLRKMHGASLDPFAAWLVLRGLRTMGLRVERQVASAATVARALERVPGVERVWYPGLESHPDHALATRVLDGPGAMVSFEVAGGLDGARRVYDRLRLVARAASLGEITSLMTHPARFSHVRVDDESRRRAGIADGLLRLSVGIEDADDLVADLRQAIMG
jgi:cystathionine beta-lyase/cystathionine gamma-synthase